MPSALRNGRFGGTQTRMPDSDPSTFHPSFKPGTKDHATNNTNANNPYITTTNPKKVSLQAAQTASSTRGTRLAVKGYGRSGPIQARTSISSIVLKRWTNCYWLHVYPATIQIFESEDNMNKWKDVFDEERGDVNDAAAAATHKKTNMALNKLSLFSWNCDAEGELQKKIDRYQNAASSVLSGISSTLSARKSKVDDDMNVRLPMKYIMEEVRSKYYDRNGPLIHTCKISYFSNTGRTIVAAFGSEEPNELKRLRGIIRYCIRLVKKASPKKHKHGMNRNSTNVSAIGESLISGMNKSALTNMSSTMYGENTMDEKTIKQYRKKKNMKKNGTVIYSQPSLESP